MLSPSPLLRRMVLGLMILPGIATAAGAATLASAPLFSLSAVNLQCEIANVGTSPVTITSVKLLSAFGDVTNADNCTGTLQPDHLCGFNSKTGAANTNPFAEVRVLGNGRSLRGQCALFDGTTQTTSTPIR
jgi:hypothetical protein